MPTEKVQRLIASERLQPGERAATIPAVRRAGTGIRVAYCKVDAGTGNTLLCYLDTDTTGPEVTVYFQLLGGITNLSDGHLSLVDGAWVPVMYRDGQWWCIIPIEGTEDCS